MACSNRKQIATLFLFTVAFPDVFMERLQEL